MAALPPPVFSQPVTLTNQNVMPAANNPWVIQNYLISKIPTLSVEVVKSQHLSVFVRDAMRHLEAAFRNFINDVGPLAKNTLIVEGSPGSGKSSTLFGLAMNYVVPVVQLHQPLAVAPHVLIWVKCTCRNVNVVVAQNGQWQGYHCVASDANKQGAIFNQIADIAINWKCTLMIVDGLNYWHNDVVSLLRSVIPLDMKLITMYFHLSCWAIHVGRMLDNQIHTI